MVGDGSAEAEALRKAQVWRVWRTANLGPCVNCILTSSQVLHTVDKGRGQDKEEERVIISEKGTHKLHGVGTEIETKAVKRITVAADNEECAVVLDLLCKSSVDGTGCNVSLCPRGGGSSALCPPHTVVPAAIYFVIISKCLLSAYDFPEIITSAFHKLVLPLTPMIPKPMCLSLFFLTKKSQLCSKIGESRWEQ